MPKNMTPEQLVRFLAVKGMGAQKVLTVTRCDDFIGVWMDDERWKHAWNPLIDANDMLELVKAMQKQDWQLILNVGFESEPILATFINHRVNSKPDQFATLDPDIKTAVCLAAAKALRAMKEKL